MKRRWAKDRITDKTHISQRSEASNARAEAGHGEGDVIICKKSRPVLVLYGRKTKITFITRLMGKTAAETVSAIMAVVQRLSPDVRRCATFDNGGEFAQHALLKGLLSETTYFCAAYASWQKGGVENTNGCLRRSIPRSTDLDVMTEQEIQEIAMTINTTPQKCLGLISPIEAFFLSLENTSISASMLTLHFAHGSTLNDGIDPLPSPEDLEIRNRGTKSICTCCAS